MKTMKTILPGIVAVSLAAPLSHADDAEEIAKKLNNPIASLTTLPMEYVHDTNIGPMRTGDQQSLKFSPVIPFSLNDDWNLISRTIVSAFMEQDIPEFGLDETGLSDIVQTFYFVPKEVGSSGIIWGAGPVILADTATEDTLGAGEWGAGPSFVALKQSGKWTVGALANYLTDFSGGDVVEQAYFQPFVSYNFTNQTSITVQTEDTWNLANNNEHGGVFIASLNQTFKVGEQLMQGRVGVRHWFDRGGTGPDSTEVMFRLTWLWPNKN